MAEAALFSIAQMVLKQLGSKVLQEAALLWGIGDDIKKLTRTLSSIQAVLLDAEEKSHSPHSHQLQLWLKELRQVVYDAEDLLDDFFIEVRRRQGVSSASEKISKEVQSFFSSSNQVAYGLKIAHGIQAIRATLDEISERREMFRLEVRPVESVARKLREQTHCDVPEMVVGREDDKERLLDQLLLQSSHRKQDNVSVVSIVGIGGLGKTTLAQFLYNVKTVQSHFEVKAWVCVSENFDVKLIVEKIIESCTNQKPERDLEMDTLRKLLHKAVNQKRYLIVLDDVWSEDREKWSFLKGLLKGGAEGSRIVITTRLLKVAKLAAPRGLEPYELKGLDESESWSLFQEIAFEGGEAKSGKHELIGREIVEKCKGVPLAIKTVAGALFSKDTESEWIAFKSKGMSEMDEDENGIMPTLKLSYNHLPTHLKHCFAYCRLFPKDHIIDVQRLIHLWIAQGYVQSPDPSNRFDVGLEYFKDLLWGSFFQEAEKDEQGGIISCKMHDLMHDLAITIAGEEIVALAVSNSQDLRSHDSRLRVARHVSFDSSKFHSGQEVYKVLCSIINHADANKLRTLIDIDSSRAWDDFDQVIIFPNTIRLRALDLKGLKMRMLSDTIHKLKHLKYFDLSNNYSMKALPKEITELLNLEVLKLDECGALEQLPIGIGKLSHLYHLGLDGCYSLTCIPRGIGQLCYLRELPWSTMAAAEGDGKSSTIAAGICELQNLNNLRKSLMLTDLENVKNPSEGQLVNLKDKQHLVELGLVWADERAEGGVKDTVASEGKLLEVLRPHTNLQKLFVGCNHGLEYPSWFPSSVMSLVQITIMGCRNWKRLPSLDQLPFLAKLEVYDMESLEYIDYCGVSSSSFPSFFPSLNSLLLRHCPEFKGWLAPVAAEAVVLPQFPSVSEMEISDCDRITSIPCFSLKLRSLEFQGGSKELLKQILRMPSPSSSSSSLPQSSCFVSLTLSGVHDLDTLPEEILPRLSSSLEDLTIKDCPELRTLSPTLPHYTCLQSLMIWTCEQLDLCDGDVDEMRQQLHSGVLMPLLSKVYWNQVPKLSRLPKWLLLAPELLQITALNCPIAYLPEWMPKLVRLQQLIIDSYGKSARQCVDADWPKIAHIQYIEINGEVVQKDGQTIALNEKQGSGEDLYQEETCVTEAEGGEEEEEEEEEASRLFSRCCSMIN